MQIKSRVVNLMFFHHNGNQEILKKRTGHEVGDEIKAPKQRTPRARQGLHRSTGDRSLTD